MTRVRGPQEISGETKVKVEPGFEPDGIDLTKPTKPPPRQQFGRVLKVSYWLQAIWAVYPTDGYGSRGLGGWSLTLMLNPSVKGTS